MEFHMSHLWFWLGAIAVSGFIYVSPVPGFAMEEK